MPSASNLKYFWGDLHNQDVYKRQEDGSIKDVRRDVNFVDYAIKWDKNKETQEKSHTSADINKAFNFIYFSTFI